MSEQPLSGCVTTKGIQTCPIRPHSPATSSATEKRESAHKRLSRPSIGCVARRMPPPTPPEVCRDTSTRPAPCQQGRRASSGVSLQLHAVSDQPLLFRDTLLARWSVRRYTITHAAREGKHGGSGRWRLHKHDRTFTMSARCKQPLARSHDRSQTNHLVDPVGAVRHSARGAGDGPGPAAGADLGRSDPRAERSAISSGMIDRSGDES